MTRNFKALGLALIAAFAMSVIVASSAQAETGFFTLEQEGFVHATREQTIGEPDEFFETATGTKLTCQVAHYTSETIPTSNETLTITPDYTDHTQGGNCRAGGVARVTVTENGCAYIFHKTDTVPGKTDYTTHAEIECPQGKVIEVHVERPLVGGSACTITVGPQTLQGTLTAQNMPAAGGNPKDVTVSGEVGVQTTQHNGNSTLCGGNAFETLEPVNTYVIKETSPLTATGTTHDSKPNGVEISHN